MSDVYDVHLKVSSKVAEKLQQMATKRHIKKKMEAPWATLAREILDNAVSEEAE